ncbi:MAG: alpha/beta fold hydrolase [Planctomycetes bacterium]|nr:alpha/beta fold hydrolase [Planctomycetota bacterium]
MPTESPIADTTSNPNIPASSDHATPTASKPTRSPIVRFLWSTLRVSLIIAIILFFARTSGIAESLTFFHPGHPNYITPAGYQDISFQTSDGLTLRGWFIPARTLNVTGPRPAVIHFHGNEGNVSQHIGFSESLPDSGISVLIFDYRSYGKSDNGGRLLNRDKLLKDSRAALKYLRTRTDVDQSRIGFLGVSLGGVYASALAAENPDIKCCALIAPFSSWQGVGWDHARNLATVLLPKGLDPRILMANYGKRPLLLIHGTEDRVVHPRHSPIIADAAKASGATVQIINVPEAGHNDVLWVQPNTIDQLEDFFKTTLIK